MAVMSLKRRCFWCWWWCFGGREREAEVREREGRRSRSRESFVGGGGGFFFLSSLSLSFASRQYQAYARVLSHGREHTRAHLSSLGLGCERFVKRTGQRQRENARLVFSIDDHRNDLLLLLPISNTHRAPFMASKPPPRATAASSACWVSTATIEALPLPPRRLLLLLREEAMRRNDRGGGDSRLPPPMLPPREELDVVAAAEHEAVAAAACRDASIEEKVRGERTKGKG